MRKIDRQYEQCLKNVSKPGRYLGNEPNAVRKDWGKADVRLALAFPDIYEIGMSHLGSRILYGTVNGLEWALAERVYAPWIDMEKEMRRRGVSLLSLESGSPLHDFDVVGFSLQHELVYTNVLNMLDLGGIPLLSGDRRGWEAPVVIAGGPCAFSPEPVSPFFDVIVPGDGEESIVRFLEAYRRFRSSGAGREDFLLHCATEQEGFYVPSLYRFRYGKGPVVEEVEKASPAVHDRIRKNLVGSIEETGCVLSPVVPLIGIVHDRPVLEIRRGCGRGCRFCQAGMISRPVRERSVGRLVGLASSMLASTGCETIALASLSTGDYSEIGGLLEGLGADAAARHYTISLPSLRPERPPVWSPRATAALKKGGVTLAPETGSDRLGAFINKASTSAGLVRAAASIYGAGWRSIKLYFIIGLPTETDEDLETIPALARQVSLSRKEVDGRPGRVGLSISYFVPRPHTPFQWRPMDGLDILAKKRAFLSNLVGRGIDFKFHDPGMSYLEAVLCRGDRRLAPVIMEAWSRGCRFDSWSGVFDMERWNSAFSACGVDPDDYARTSPGYGEVLAWEHLETGVEKSFLAEEDRKAERAEPTGDCAAGECNLCGVCPSLGARTILASGSAGG